MPTTMQEFLADATLKAATDLADALLRLPEDKRAWSAGGEARTALDQVAECALLTGYTAETVQTRAVSSDMIAKFVEAKTQLAAQPWDTIHAQLMDSAQKMAAVARAVPDTALTDEIDLPWRKMTVAELIAIPYWNLTYHLGQINYIAALAGVLG